VAGNESANTVGILWLCSPSGAVCSASPIFSCFCSRIVTRLISLHRQLVTSYTVLLRSPHRIINQHRSNGCAPEEIRCYIVNIPYVHRRWVFCVLRHYFLVCAHGFGGSVWSKTFWKPGEQSLLPRDLTTRSYSQPVLSSWYKTSFINTNFIINSLFCLQKSLFW
jgi:hypothetical protein